jgi:hypothetical protein
MRARLVGGVERYRDFSYPSRRLFTSVRASGVARLAQSEDSLSVEQVLWMAAQPSHMMDINARPAAAVLTDGTLQQQGTAEAAEASRPE